MNGGTAGLIYGFMVCTAGYGLVYASLAEMASMYVVYPVHLPIQSLSIYLTTYRYALIHSRLIKTEVIRSPTAGGQYHVNKSLVSGLPSIVPSSKLNDGCSGSASSPLPLARNS